MYAVYKKLDGQDQVLELRVRACRGINSSGRVVKTVMQGLTTDRETGRPKKIWWDCVKNGMESLALPKGCAVNDYGEVEHELKLSGEAE